MKYRLGAITIAVLGSFFLFAAPVGAQTVRQTNCATVVVDARDTLSIIAVSNGTTWAAMAAINHIPNPNLIFPGQVFATCGTSNGASAAQPAAQPSAPVHAAVPQPSAPVVHAAAPHPVAAQPQPQQYVASGNVPDMIRAVFGPYAGQALRIAACESGYNPGAVNRSSNASGVFQFLPSTWAGTPYAGRSVFDANANINAAYWLFARDGHTWREWQCQA